MAQAITIRALGAGTLSLGIDSSVLGYAHLVRSRTKTNSALTRQ